MCPANESRPAKPKEPSLNWVLENSRGFITRPVRKRHSEGDGEEHVPPKKRIHSAKVGSLRALQRTQIDRR